MVYTLHPSHYGQDRYPPFVPIPEKSYVTLFSSPPPEARPAQRRSTRPQEKDIWRLVGVITFMVLCDRFHVIGTVTNKIPNEIGVLIAVAAITIATIRFGKHDDVLNLDQTTEIKGMLQTILLLYHLNGKSTDISVLTAGVIRLDVATFIFFTGFGHTLYTLKKRDGFDLKRFLGLLIRINFLCVVVAVAMNRAWFSYYFIPLTTIWTCIVYLTNSIFVFLPPWVRVFLLWLVSLSLFLFVPCTPLVASPVLKFWCSRGNLDIFSATHGMMAATLLPSLKVFFKRVEGSVGLSLATVGLSVTFIFGWIFVAGSVTESLNRYNKYHFLLSFFPVTGFLLLRNITPAVRRARSTAMVWMGNISLELYIAQYHIWLAAGATRNLKLFFENYWLDLTVKTALFLGACNLLRISSNAIINYIFSNEDLNSNAKLGLLGIVVVILWQFGFII